MLLSSSEFPWFARNMNRFEPIAKQADPRVATNTVYHGSARAVLPPAAGGGLAADPGCG